MVGVRTQCMEIVLVFCMKTQVSINKYNSLKLGFSLIYNNLAFLPTGSAS